MDATTGDALALPLSRLERLAFLILCKSQQLYMFGLSASFNMFALDVLQVK
ncbi:hypothetical protein M407DRAFT_19199 [Tulasnella calospora MUT 4182]|uniref:Uncharacterized protein n=1 Tax=Tulasnella calospora MUT 4182 TaxID=1051891 RepID=A0A0C3QIM4_9AGAM|nr:hypothetical protein M407DRAFT_19199 [Tulasnella calospora MUT 4182]